MKATQQASTNLETDFSVLTQQSDLRVDNVDLTGAALVVPTDAPLPNEIESLAVTGDLYARLGAIARGDDLIVAPLSGPELTGAAGIWRAISKRARVYVLTGLPGARYDVVFTGAMRQIGLRSVDWSDVAETLARVKAETQSRTDAQPWTAPGPRPFTGRRRKADDPSAPTLLPDPEDDGEYPE